MRYTKVLGIKVKDFDSVIDYEMNYPPDDATDPAQDREMLEAEGKLCVIAEIEEVASAFS